jgi:hypothetical protein
MFFRWFGSSTGTRRYESRQKIMEYFPLKRPIVLLYLILIINILYGHQGEYISIGQDKCGCFSNHDISGDNVISATQITTKNEKELTAHCANIMRMYISDDKGREFEEVKVECISKEAKKYKITDNTSFLVNEGGDALPEKLARETFFDMIKTDKSLFFTIKHDNESNIEQIERLWL